VSPSGGTDGFAAEDAVVYDLIVRRKALMLEAKIAKKIAFEMWKVV
jgi:hypothetical protein